MATLFLIHTLRVKSKQSGTLIYPVIHITWIHNLTYLLELNIN